ncbi:MAG: hypothetical protein GY767_17875 [Shimia sp.]|nr:hypothetical protein [Shimia sp.]
MTAIARIGRAAPEADVVEKCQELLRMAESGELRGIVYGGILDEGMQTTGFSVSDRALAIGLMFEAAHNLAAHGRDEAEHG